MKLWLCQKLNRSSNQADFIARVSFFFCSFSNDWISEMALEICIVLLRDKNYAQQWTLSPTLSIISSTKDVRFRPSKMLPKVDGLSFLLFTCLQGCVHNQRFSEMRLRLALGFIIRECVLVYLPYSLVIINWFIYHLINFALSFLFIAVCALVAIVKTQSHKIYGNYFSRVSLQILRSSNHLKRIF